MAQLFKPIRWSGLLYARPLLALTGVSRPNGRVVREASSRVPDAEINGIKVEKVDRCVVLRMERGENRLNGEFYDSMHKALDIVESYDDATALVTTGSGKYYSTGLDLDELNSGSLSLSDKIEFFSELQRLMKRMLTFPLVSVAAINGHVYAGGAFLAMAQDYRVMRTERGWYCLSEVNIGIVFPGAMFEMLRALLPQPARHQAAVLGPRYTAEEAIEAKLVDEICSIDKLEETALSAAKRLAGEEGLDRRTLAAIKHHLYEDLCTTLSEPPQLYHPFE